MKKKKVDPRFLKEEGREVFTGNELLVKGLLETEGGTHLWTGYPGSPIAGFFDCIEAIQAILRQYGIQATMANNEALSAAMVNGSQMHGLRALTAMKSVGLHVASDALALGNLAGAHPEGGAVVVCGDDPWSDSTQVPADSRYLCKHMHMPILEPSSNQEVKDWIDLAFRLSSESELYMGYLVTTNQADGGGSVEVRRNHFPRINTHNKFAIDTAQVDFETKVLLPPRTWRQEQDLPSRYQRLWASARRHGANTLLLPSSLPASSGLSKRWPIGFLSSGLAYSYLQHALQEMELADTFPLLKFGISYPMDPSLLEELSQHCERIIIVEERRGFLEEQAATFFAQKGNSAPQIYGKTFPAGLEGFPSSRGLNPSLVLDRLAPLLLHLTQQDPLASSFSGEASALSLASLVNPPVLERELALLREVESFDINLVPRTPTFCPGCPHRDSASVLVEIKKEFADPEIMQQRHHREPIDLVFHGDTGCYTMLMFEPTKDLMHNYSGMGLGGATGLGIDPFITNKQVVFMGDGTFFHSGQLAISNSIKNSQDITYIILDNKTTAMTGHQPTAGIEPDIMGNSTFIQRIDQIIEGMKEHDNLTIARTNPEHRETYKTLLEETILQDGVKVIIADKECGITFHRRNHRDRRQEIQEKGYVREWKHINITTDVCENCLVCTQATGCPGLTFTETDLGRKVQTDLSWCVADTACTKLHACPSFEEVTILRSHQPLSRLPALENLPLPSPHTIDSNNRFHIYLAGVGGMGIATVTATLVRAGHRQGYEVHFCDRNGLAIRNGGVYAQITYGSFENPPASPLIPYGKANLILGIDPLEAARGLDPQHHIRIGSPHHTVALVNQSKTPTILTLLGQDDFCVQDLEDTLKKYTQSRHYFGIDLSEASERFFSTKLYANIMMLGVAYQLGHLPLELESIEYGIQETMGRDVTQNVKAFQLGRKMALDAQEKKKETTQASDYHSIVTEKTEILRSRGLQGVKQAQDYWGIVTGAIAEINLDSSQQAFLASRIYDLMEYENADFARDYVSRLQRLHEKDTATHHYAATAAALWNLHRVMAIKDEVYVAHLLTSEEKYRRDYERYNIHPELGDKIIYRHLNRPEFVIGQWNFRFKIRTQPWMLRLMKRMKFLRQWLPGWHAEERAFRDWYFDLVEQFPSPHSSTGSMSSEEYRQWVALLRLPEEARGYREVRYPAMRAAQERGQALLAQLRERNTSLAPQAQTTMPS